MNALNNNHIIDDITMRKILAPCLFLLILFGCEKNYVVAPDLPSEPVSFQNDLIPIFEANCNACHKNGSQKPAFTSDVAYDQLLTDGPNAPYVDTINPKQSLLYKKLNGGGMPPSGSLPSAKIALFLQWITEGAKNN